MRKKVVALAVALQTIALFAVNTNLVEKVKERLLCQISIDVFPDGYTAPTFADWYGGVMRESGCSTNEILSALAYVGTNCCADANSHTNSTDSSIMGAAICHLGRFDLAHDHVGAIYFAVTNNAGSHLYEETCALVDVLGMGHDAFLSYDGLLRRMPLDRACDITGAVGATVKHGSYPACVTNRTICLFIGALALRKCSPAYADMALCDLWQGYGTSSNRLINLNDGIGQSMPDFILSYLNEKKNELLALPPGTMQMLSTNQFYNVED